MGNFNNFKIRYKRWGYFGKVNNPLRDKLKKSEWVEYKIKDLFDVVGTKSLDSNAVEFIDNGINFVGRTFANNGIQGKIEKQKFEPNDPFTITATVIGNYKYAKLQRDPYYCSQNINKLTPKPIVDNWNIKTAYFFISNIQKFVSLYNGQQGGYKLDDIKNHSIKIPYNNQKIDYDFMRDIISTLEYEYILKIERYLRENELELEIKSNEKDALRNLENTIFKEFSIVDIFSIKNTGNILSSSIVENSGLIPYLCASALNNSVSSYIKYDEKYLDKGNCIFIGGKTFVVTYQKDDFFSNDSHNLTLTLNKEEHRNRICQIFLATCVKSSLGHKYSWGDSISSSKIKKDTILLPVNNNDQPDYAFMENYISGIQKIIVKKLITYLRKKKLNKLQP